MERAGSIVRSIVRDLGMEEGLQLSKIKRGWPELFRPPLGLHMSPVALKDSELLLNVDSPEWLQQISFLKADVLGRLVPFGVSEIRLKLGRVWRPESGRQSGSRPNALRRES